MHRNARLTPAGRLLLCQRIEAGWPVAHAAAAMGISRDRAYVWWRRYQDEGRAGLEDRSSRPHRSPNRTRPAIERRIVTLRQNRGLGPARIAGIVRRPASTVHRVLVRHQLNRLDRPDRATHEGPHPAHRDVPTGRARPSRRQEAGPDPTGGGLARPRPLGPAEHLSHTQGGHRLRLHPFGRRRLQPSGLLRSPLQRAGHDRDRLLAPGTPKFFAAHDVSIERVLTDNGACYRAKDFARALGDVAHTFTRPYRPATNGKVERFNRTLLGEWAYPRPWSSEGQRTRALARWLHIYNHHRHHTAIGGPPVSRVSNLTGSYS